MLPNYEDNFGRKITVSGQQKAYYLPSFGDFYVLYLYL